MIHQKFRQYYITRVGCLEAFAVAKLNYITRVACFEAFALAKLNYITRVACFEAFAAAKLNKILSCRQPRSLLNLLAMELFF